MVQSIRSAYNRSTSKAPSWKVKKGYLNVNLCGPIIVNILLVLMGSRAKIDSNPVLIVFNRLSPAAACQTRAVLFQAAPQADTGWLRPQSAP